MTYRTGELDQRITFQERQSTPDGLGGNVTAWVDVSEAWAHVRPASAKEAVNFDKINEQSAYVFIVRNRQDIKAAFRIVWGGELFNITGVKQPKTRALFMEIEGVSGGGQ
jgi:SPP1 family predicted phage head-tail adaptor